MVFFFRLMFRLRSEVTQPRRILCNRSIEAWAWHRLLEKSIISFTFVTRTCSTEQTNLHASCSHRCAVKTCHRIAMLRQLYMLALPDPINSMSRWKMILKTILFKCPLFLSRLPCPQVNRHTIDIDGPPQFKIRSLPIKILA